MPWHTATPKKIKYLVVVSGEATNYEKVFYLRTAPQYPHNYMEVVSARLSNFAQPIGASGYKKTPPFPLSGSGGVSIVNQDSSADIHTAYPFLFDLDTLAIFDFLLDFPVDAEHFGGVGGENTVPILRIHPPFGVVGNTGCPCLLVGHSRWKHRPIRS